MTESKKIDVTEAAHAVAHDHCKSSNLRVKTWVSTLILREISSVKKKGIEQLPPARESDIWQRPPFWAKS
jgi:hypothetical protein